MGKGLEEAREWLEYFAIVVCSGVAALQFK
jgi:hypothetical protein